MARLPHLGSKVRRLRQAHELSQVEAATRLGISASYLNLIEHNQRPLTVALLFKIGQLFDIDLRDWSEGDETRLAADIRETLSDPVLKDSEVPDSEVMEAVSSAPGLSQAITELYAAYRRSLDNIQSLGDRLAEEALLSRTGYEMRSVLTSIRSFSEILREHEDLDDAQRQQFLSILVDESHRLSSVIDDAIDVADEENLQAMLGQRQPSEEVSRLLERHNNHFPTLETAAEDLTRTWTDNRFDAPERIAEALADQFGVMIQFDRTGDLTETPQTTAPTDGEVSINACRPIWEITFDLAKRYAHLAHRPLFAAYISLEAGSPAESATHLDDTLASYFAAAVLMSYDAFHAAAEASHYDLDALAQRFQVPRLTVARRLTSLRRPGSAGLAFHLLVVDVAGNVRERIPGSGMPLPRFGSACPRWDVHRAFASPGAILSQSAEMPDGAAYFCVSSTEGELAYTIGCPLEQARHMVYLQSATDRTDHPVTQPVPVGTNCRICPRHQCPDRAFVSVLTPPTEAPAA